MYPRIWQNRTFGHKILLYVFLIISLALLIAGTALIAYEATNSRQEFMRETTAIADIISQTCASAITFQDNDFATQILNGLGAENSIINACIVNAGIDN